MTHDPICPQGEGASISTTPYGLEDFPCLLCELIAKVRGDERRKAEIHTYHQPAWTAGFEAALDAAREAVARLDIGRDVRFSVDVQADALAAIDALRGQR